MNIQFKDFKKYLSRFFLKKKKKYLSHILNILIRMKKLRA